MKIKKITISGYRSIKNSLELEFKDVNALIGGNNVGKNRDRFIRGVKKKLAERETEQK